MPIFTSETLKNVRMEAIQTIFTTTDFTALPTQAVKDARNVHDPANSTDLVFKVVPNAAYDDFTCQFSSEYVASALARRFAANEEAEVMSFARALENRPILASFRGDFLECRAHRIFQKGASGQLRSLASAARWRHFELFPP